MGSLTKEQKSMIDKIDGQLDKLLKKMEYEQYLDFLRSDDYLATYDDVLGYNDIHYLPDAFLSGLTLDFLNKVKAKVDKKVEEIESMDSK